MKRLLPLFGFVLAVLWVPIVSHCTWENIPDLPFFQCESGAPASSQESDCNDDACFTVESASYKISEADILLPIPSFQLLVQVPVSKPILEKQPSPVTAAPSEITIGWQFSSRASLLPRAPSSVS